MDSVERTVQSWTSRLLDPTHWTVRNRSKESGRVRHVCNLFWDFPTWRLETEIMPGLPGETMNWWIISETGEDKYGTKSAADWPHGLVTSYLRHECSLNELDLTLAAILFREACAEQVSVASEELLKRAQRG